MNVTLKYYVRSNSYRSSFGTAISEKQNFWVMLATINRPLCTISTNFLRNFHDMVIEYSIFLHAAIVPCTSQFAIECIPKRSLTGPCCPLEKTHSYGFASSSYHLILVSQPNTIVVRSPFSSRIFRAGSASQVHSWGPKGTRSSLLFLNPSGYSYSALASTAATFNVLRYLQTGSHRYPYSLLRSPCITSISAPSRRPSSHGESNIDLPYCEHQ